MKEIKFYDFDLDLSCDKRWGPIFDTFVEKIPSLRENLRHILSQFGLATTLVKPLYNMTSENSILFYDEICYIAKRMDMDPYEILLMQLVYETSSACTAAVLNVGGKEFFFRTMDWPMMFLKDITIGLNVIRGGKTIGKVTTWAGYTGFLTATNTTDNYTITINYRRTQEISLTSLVKNLYRTMAMKWPIGYLVRYVIQNNLSKFQVESGKILENSELISPCYITLYSPGNTTIITRDCDKAVSVRNTELVQTNCDWNKTEPDILWSIARRNAIGEAQKLLSDKKDISSKDVLKILLKHPILNEETVYVHFQYGDEYRTLV